MGNNTMFKPKLSKKWQKHLIASDGSMKLFIVLQCKNWEDAYGKKIDNPLKCGRGKAHIIAPNRVCIAQDDTIACMYYKHNQLHGILLGGKNEI